MRRLLLFFFSHRTLALINWDLHFIAVRIKNALFFRRRKLLKRVSDQNGRLYLNLGSGPRGLDSPEWINIDGFLDKNVHYLCDFNRPLPFADEIFDGIFCEHVLEHFTYENGKRLLLECKRVLKKNGVLRIVVPDGNKILQSYFKQPEYIVEYKHVASGLPMEAVNTWFYQRYEHQCIYDAAYLIHLLNECGYAKSSQSSFQNSVAGAGEILLDDPKYSWESLYAESVK